MAAESQVAFIRADVPLDERTLAAIRWTEGLEQSTGRRAGLVTPLARDYSDPLRAFASGRPSTSVKTAASLGPGPLLAYCIGLEGLVKFRHRRPLVYVAWPNDYWLDGWAAAIGAVDIMTRHPLAEAQDPVSELLKDLDLAGNNGWFDAWGKRDARRILQELDHLVGRSYAVGAMLAADHSKKSLEGLRKL